MGRKSICNCRQALEQEIKTHHCLHQGKKIRVQGLLDRVASPLYCFPSQALLMHHSIWQAQPSNTEGHTACSYKCIVIVRKRQTHTLEALTSAPSAARKQQTPNPSPQTAACGFSSQHEEAGDEHKIPSALM